jgi:hypothetical protein
MDTPKPPAALNRFVQMVLSYKPKPKTKPAKARQRSRRKIERTKHEA